MVDQSYIRVDETSVGKISPELIGQSDETNTKLNEWDDIGEIDMLIADTLHKGIRVPEVPKVKDYLSNFPELIEILPSVCKVTKEKFPLNKAQLLLEVNKDFSEDTEFLILYVRQENMMRKLCKYWMIFVLLMEKS